VAALEDKIIQRATVAVLNCIFQEDVLRFSYGFRPGRSQHDALDALCVGTTTQRVNFIFDADVRSFLDPFLYGPLVHEVSSKSSV
jgi:retron-type reverse transcriptase